MRRRVGEEWLQRWVDKKEGGRKSGRWVVKGIQLHCNTLRKGKTGDDKQLFELNPDFRFQTDCASHGPA